MSTQFTATQWRKVWMFMLSVKCLGPQKYHLRHMYHELVIFAIVAFSG